MRPPRAASSSRSLGSNCRGCTLLAVEVLNAPCRSHEQITVVAVIDGERALALQAGTYHAVVSSSPGAPGRRQFEYSGFAIGIALSANRSHQIRFGIDLRSIDARACVGACITGACITAGSKCPEDDPYITRDQRAPTIFVAAGGETEMRASPSGLVVSSPAGWKCRAAHTSQVFVCQAAALS